MHGIGPQYQRLSPPTSAIERINLPESTAKAWLRVLIDLRDKDRKACTKTQKKCENECENESDEAQRSAAMPS